MLQVDLEHSLVSGPHGDLPIGTDDEVARKFLMLIDGECNGLGAPAAAEKYGYSRQRYYQVRKLYTEGGAGALASQKRGPKANSRRTPDVEREIIRLLFLDPEAPASVVAQKLKQRQIDISISSVQRTISDYGLKKKPL
jgi:hypothetical protein